MGNLYALIQVVLSRLKAVSEYLTQANVDQLMHLRNNRHGLQINTLALGSSYSIGSGCLKQSDIYIVEKSTWR